MVRLDERIHRIKADQTDEALAISIFNSNVQGEEQSSRGLIGNSPLTLTLKN